MVFFGQHRSVEELRRLVGDLSQLASVTPVEFTEGSSRGVRGLQVRAGAMRFTVVLDRGMDLADVEAGTIPFGWRTGVGYVHPAFFDPTGIEWLWTYEGGLMTTGGLSQMGDPSDDRGEEFGLHGRIALAPAVETGYRVDWESGRIEIWGRLRELKPLTRNLELERRIACDIGATRIEIRDRVTNRGRLEEPHMMLYHTNFGYPLLDEGARFLAPVVETFGWDELSQERLAFSTSVPGLRDEEYVFGHRLEPRDTATLALVNAKLGEGTVAALRYSPKELPHLWQWESLYPGSFVMGIEPSQSHIRGRAAARAERMLPTLKPGESRSYAIEFEFGFGPEAVSRIEREIAAQGEGTK